MPFDRSRYPADWEAFTARIRERAGNCCEWANAAGERCNAPNGRSIVRNPEQPEQWADVDPRDAELPVVRVVLTTAHTCKCDPPCAEPEHVLSLCQLHHLRLDAKLHAVHAAEARRAKRVAAGQGELGIAR